MNLVTQVFTLLLLASTCASASMTMSMGNEPVPSSTSSATGTIYTVTVSKIAHRFDPETLNVKPGDIISFEFFPTNHSVIRGTYESPCIPYEDFHPDEAHAAIWSGWQPVSMIMNDDEMPWWNYTVMSNDTLYIYCGAPGSCNKSGMVMIINPNSTVSIDLYRSKAEQAPFVLTPGQPWPDNENGESATPTSSSVPTTMYSPAISATTVILQVTPTIGTSPAPAATSAPAKGVPIGAIAGIVIGSIALIAMIGFLFYLFLRRRPLPHEIFHSSHGGDTLNRNTVIDRDRKVMSEISVDPYSPGANSIRSPTINGTMSPTRETIIIPMTEEEKNLYLEKLATSTQGFGGSVRSLGSDRAVRGRSAGSGIVGTRLRPAEMPAGRMSLHTQHPDELEEFDDMEPEYMILSPDHDPNMGHHSQN